MPVKPRNIVLLLPDAWAFLRGIYRQKRFIMQTVKPALKQFSSDNDGSLRKADVKKIMLYYGIAVPAITGEFYCRLRGYPMTNRERLAATGLGVVTGLFDDFFDAQNLSEDEILARISSSNSNPASSPGDSSTADKVFQYFIRMILDNIPPDLPVETGTRLMFDAQLESRRQKSSVPLNRQELNAITRLKGGYAVLFFRHAFEHPLIDGEYDALMSAGEVLQYGNDIFDVYEDMQSGIQTLPNTALSVEQIREEFTSLLFSCFAQFRALAYRKKDIESALILLHVIAGRCFVCLDGFQKAQNSRGGVWRPTLIPRSELICDMEKPVNMLRSTRFYLEHAR